MASVQDVVAQFDASLVKADTSVNAMTAAASSLDEACGLLGPAVAGAGSPVPGQSLAALDHARRNLDEAITALHAAAGAVRTYLAFLTGSSTHTISGAARASPAPATPRPGVAGRLVERLRTQLPPPVRPGTGQKTHGRWIAPDGAVHAEASGRDENSAAAIRFFEQSGAPRIPSAVTDVEMKLVAHMRRHQITSATLVLNNIPCRGPLSCDTLVPVILPEGSTLTVHGPDGFTKTYRGGQTPPWAR